MIGPISRTSCAFRDVTHPCQRRPLRESGSVCAETAECASSKMRLGVDRSISDPITGVSRSNAESGVMLGDSLLLTILPAFYVIVHYHTTAWALHRSELR